MALSAGEITAIVVGSGNVAAWAKLFYNARKNGKQNGIGRPCPLHSGIEQCTTEAVTNLGKIEKDLDTVHIENRDDHKKIFDKLESLAVAIANASAAAASAASVAASIMARRKMK